MTTPDLVSKTLEALGDDPTAATMYYSRGEVLVGLNTAQRLFCLLTLCLETIASYTYTSSATPIDMLGVFADWLLPLRIVNSNGQKVRPATLADLAALDNNWRSTVGEVSKYSPTGFGLVSFYKRPTSPASLSITYARCPVLMTNSVDPEIAEQYHPNLIDAAVPILRAKEGAQEWQKTVDRWQRFIDAAREYAVQVRARNQEMGYDNLPAEIARFDRSHVLKRGA